MTDRDATTRTCEPADVVAYLDGEMDGAASASFERHLQECAACASALNEQKRLNFVLNATFGCTTEKEFALPENFAKIVTAHAQTDMSGMRRTAESRRALLFCLALACAAFALLGASLFDAVLAPVAGIARASACLLGMASRALFDAGICLSIVFRTIGGQLVAEPGAARFFVWTVFAVAVALLLRLIGRYHRSRIPD